MKYKIEKFLKGKLYLFLVVLISFVIWSFKYYVPIERLVPLVFYGLFSLTIPLALILIFFEKTIYTVPIIFAMLFTIGIPGMGIDTIPVAVVGFLNILIVIVSFIFHTRKYKVTFKLKSLGLSLILASISFIIPLFYTPINETSLLLTLLLPIYLLIYLFYVNTVEKEDINYLMRVFVITGLLLTFQLMSMWFVSFLSWEGTNLLEDFVSIFPRGANSNPQWGNINDLTIHLVLFTSGTIYYLKKYNKSMLPWLNLGLTAYWIYISDSRGSIITITLVGLSVITYVLIKRNKESLINLLITVIITLLLAVFLMPVIKEVYESLVTTLGYDDPNQMLSGRIELWWGHEYSAWNEFLKYPLFGRGWYTENWILGPDNRVTIYHSTLFQILATSGLFGLSVLVYQFIKIGTIFKNNIKEFAVVAFLLTYILSQLHGLIDNTQYMVHYSVVTFISLAIIENINNKTNTDIIDLNNDISKGDF